jgi:serine/threonine protein kinase
MDEKPEEAVGIVTDRVESIVCEQCGSEIDVADLDSFLRVECPDCGHVEIVPAKLGQFLLLDLIGSGGMGGVYYAKDETLGRFVAIKVMLRSLGSDRKFVENFKREAQAAARLNHPSIVQIYSFGQEKGQPYIVMELVSGGALDKAMDPQARGNEAMVMQAGLHIAEGLMAADEAGLIHGDIKPENILFDDKGHAKLVDFGIASFASQGSGEGGVWGTPYYIAPEKVQRQTSDARSDIYSLGATLYHALTGRPPFEGKTSVDVVKARLGRLPVPPSSALPSIDPATERIVMRMLQPEPSMRYPTYASLIGDLRKNVRQTVGRPHSVFSKTSRMAAAKRSSGPMYAMREDANARTGPHANTARHGFAPEPAQRIVVHRKRPNSAPSPMDEYRTLATGGGSGSAGKPVMRRKRKKSRAGKWVALTVLLVALLGGLAAWVVVRHQKETARRRDQAALAVAVDNAGKTLADIKETVATVVARAEQGQSMRTNALQAVLVVLGEPLEAPAAEDSAAPEKPVSTDKRVTTDGASAVPAPPTAAADKTDESASLIPSRDQIDAERERLRRFLENREKPAPDAAPAPDAPAPPVASDSEVPAEPAAAPEPEPAIKTQTRKILEFSDRLAVQAAEAREMEASATALHARLPQTGSLDMAKGLIDQIDALLERARQTEKESGALFQEAESVYAEIHKMRTAVENERQAQIKAQEEADRLAKEAQEQREKEEAYREKVKNELAQVDLARVKGLLLAKQNSFRDLLERFGANLADLQTEEGRAAARLLTERYKRLADMKSFLTRSLEKHPPTWIWVAPGTGARLDVLGATEKGVQVRGRAQPVPWSQVSPAQMVEFFDHYTTLRQISLREQDELRFNAALYCEEVVGEAARAKAKEYMGAALKSRPALGAEARRLMPALFDDDGF